MRCMDPVTRWSGLICGEGSSEFALDEAVASSVAVSSSCSTVLVRFVLEGSVFFGGLVLVAFDDAVGYFQ